MLTSAVSVLAENDTYLIPPLGSAIKRPQSAQGRAHVHQGGLPALQTLQFLDTVNSHRNKWEAELGWFCAAAAPSCFFLEKATTNAAQLLLLG